MKLRMLFSTLLGTAVAVAVLGVSAAAQTQQPSLADVAKQKSSEKKAKRVITDDDMPSTSQPATTAQPKSLGGASSGSESGSDNSSKESGQQGVEKSDKPAGIPELENELKLIVHDEELLKKRLDQLRQKADNASDPFRKQMYEDSIQNQQVTLEEFAKKRKELENKIAAEKSKSKG